MTRKYKTRKEKIMLTHNDITKVLKLWDNKTTAEIALEIGKPQNTVTYIAMQIRKAGYKLPRKRTGGQTMLMVKEVLKNLNLI